MGNTVYVIGTLESLGIAETAVDMLLSGSEHSTVYNFLENKRRGLKESILDSVELE
jgi:ribosomal RNA assembly protein